MRKTTLTLALATLVFSFGLSTTPFAASHHEKPSMHFHGRHAAPPIVVHHYGPRPHHYGPHRYYYSDWVAPLVLGAAILGTAEVVRQASGTTVVESVPSVEVSTPTTRFWCESEKGYYPEVRACPAGWKAITTK